MTQKIIEWIKEDRLYKFYKTKEWLMLRDEILKTNHNECAWCKAKGVISKAVTVHHMRYVKTYPELALSRTYTYNGKQYANLVPLCHDCHDKAHGRIAYKKHSKPITEERW